jgi:hypothetical protein
MTSTEVSISSRTWYDPQEKVYRIRATNSKGLKGRAMPSDTGHQSPSTHELAAHHPYVQRALGLAAHDLNNTVGAIANFADFLVDDLDGEDPRRADIERIQALARETSAYLRNLLAVAGRDFLEPQRVAIGDVLREVVAAPSVAVPVRLVATARANVLLVNVDPVRLRDVVSAFVANAAEAGGGEEILVELEHIDAAAPVVAISVRDRGRGLPEEVRPDPFVPLTRAPDGRKRWSLAKAAGFASQVGGTITICTQPGEGTTVTLSLPVAPSVTGGAP